MAMDRALVLGGGGPVGVAWETGLIAGLAAEGVKAAEADLIQGTSAGSIVGAQLAAGRDPAAMADFQSQPLAAPPPGAPTSPPDLSKLMAFFARMPSDGEPSIDLRREMGRLSLDSQTTPEEAFIGMIGAALPSAAWPERFACTAVDAESGEFHIWRQADGIDLRRGVASSCAVPGIYPAVTINGRRWMDGGMRSGVSIDKAGGYKRTLALAVMPPMASAMMRPRIEREMAAAAREGAKIELIAPDAASGEAFGANLMDARRRPIVCAAGLAQGRREAARLKAFWG